MPLTSDQIKALREETGAGVMDCRSALEQADGDLEAARLLLREKGIATASKRADRSTIQRALFEGFVRAINEPRE